MTKIELKDSTTVVESFAYGLTDVGNITKITDGDGVNWNYTYDVNNRLVT
ncbi:MAG: RHS repeat protein, partial [Planctomycetes bacterium]|nr:RHS repeat protein [Planctomycetota bacterium]